MSQIDSSFMNRGGAGLLRLTITAMVLLGWVDTYAADFSWNSSTTRDEWTDGAHWVGGVAPGAGDTVVNPTQYGRVGINADIDIEDIRLHEFTSNWILQNRTFSAITRELRVHGTLEVRATAAQSFTTYNTGANGLLNVVVNNLVLTNRGIINFGDRFADVNNISVTGLTQVISDAGSVALRVNANQADFSGGVYMESVGNLLASFAIANDETRAGNTSVAFLDGGDLWTEIYANSLGGVAGNFSMEAVLTIDGDTGASYTFGGELHDLQSAGNSAVLGLRKTGSNTQKIQGDSTYSGDTDIEEGALFLNGDNASALGPVTVASGATLAGQGTIGGATTVSGILSPGGLNNLQTLTFVNDLTWNGGSSPGTATDWRFELGSPSHDQAVITSGDFLKGSGSHFRFDFSGYDQTGTFTLIDWSGTTDFSASDFSYVSLDPLLSATFAINGSQLDVTIAVDCDEPTITLGAFPEVCAGTTSASLSYSATTENPATYSLDYDAAANTEGFVDVVDAALSAAPDTIPIVIPVGASVGTYQASLTVKTAAGCQSLAVPITVTVIDTPGQPGSITQGNPSGSTVCEGDSGVTYSISGVASATAYTWSVPSGASITAGQGTTQITVDWGTAASGDVSVTAQNSCGTSVARTKPISVNTAPPAAPTATAGTDISTTAFTANWDALAGALGYELDIADTEDFSSGFIVNNLDVGTATDHSVSGLSAGQTYYYRVRAYNACGSGADSETIVVLTPVVLAGWDMSPLVDNDDDTVDLTQSGFGPSPYAATESDSRVTVGGLTRGSGLFITTWGGQDGGWGGLGFFGDKADNISNDNVGTFTVQADPGLQVSFFSIARFDYFSEAVHQASGNGPKTGAIQYSTNGTDFVDIATVDFSTNEIGSVGPIDLTGVAGLQNLPEQTEVTFRIVPYDSGATSRDWLIYNLLDSTANDFEVRGTFCSTPTAYTVGGGGDYCSDEAGATITLSGSQVGVRYQLYRNGGATAVGSPVSGTGGALSFGPQAVEDTYTVVATRTAGGCEADMNGSVSVSVVQSPGVPSNLQATPSSGQVALSWTAPATGPAPTGYNVKRSQNSGGPYTTLPAGANVSGTSFTDTTALDGNIYFYVITALNGICEGDEPFEVEAEMPQQCPTGLAPELAGSGNITVTVGNSLNVIVSASEAAEYCPAPTLSHTTLPGWMSFADAVDNDTRTRTYSGTPTAGDVGTYPIVVTAEDQEDLTNTYSFLVYVGASGEPNNGTTNPPPSQSDWAVPITNLQNTGGSNADVMFEAQNGMTYDILYSDSAFGPSMSWQHADTVTAGGGSASGSVTEGTRRYYQVTPSGIDPTTNGLWAVIKPMIGGGISMVAPPIATDGDFLGDLGNTLAEVLPSGTLAWILTPGATATWTELTLNGSGTWVHTSGPIDYVVDDGQGYMINNPGGSAQPTFSGPVGNVGTQAISVASGYNILSLSQGLDLRAADAFESANPVGSHDSTQADQVWILNSNGSWRQLIRRPGGTWYDTATRGTTAMDLEPGQAYYYIRRGGATSIDF